MVVSKYLPPPRLAIAFLMAFYLGVRLMGVLRPISSLLGDTYISRTRTIHAKCCLVRGAHMPTIPFDHTDGKAEQKVVALNMTNVAHRRLLTMQRYTIATFLSARCTQMRMYECIWLLHIVSYLPAAMLNIKNSVLAR